jgi:ankyrin repeat protein
LPKSLNETYERILEGIPEPQKQRAKQILQCLTVATRPLRVAELAQVLTVKIPGGGHLPTVEEDLRWEDEEHDVLTACSSLIVLVDVDNSRLVQFSHSSIKEFLTSSHRDPLHRIHLEPAHATMAQACLGLLCRLDYKIDNTRIEKNFPLAEYAAQNWVSHASFENVLSDLEHGVGHILDGDKPHLAAWLWVRKRSLDISGRSSSEDHPRQLAAAPLYYVAELGLTCLVQYLVSKHPEDVNTKGGRYGTPLHAAVHERHIEALELLANKNVDVRDSNDQIPLHAASRLGYTDIGRQLINRGADVNARDNKHRTSLNLAACEGRLEVIQILLKHKADVTIRDERGKMPLHAALDGGSLKAARLLLQHGADADAKVNTNQGQTPLQHAAQNRQLDFVRLLLEYRADVNVQDTTKKSQIPLHYAVWDGDDDVMQLLLNHGADVNAKDDTHTTPLHLASYRRHLKAVQLLLENGANVRVRDKEGKDPLGVASKRRHPEIMRILTEHMRRVNNS